jgi:putative ABC transport system permease protein
MAHYHRETKQIIGVVGNFHYRGMQEEVGPLILDIEDSLMDTITLSVRTDNMKGLIAHLREVWEAHFPGVPFEYSFLDDDFDRQYWYEKQMGRLLGITTTQGLAIACLGLFGLALFITQYRTKEIGIRRVLGASPVDIAVMLSKKFVRLIFVAALIASPLALYSMNRWLQDFAYRIDVAWIVFPLAAAGALLIALATIWYQGLRAAGVNPVNSLRNE